MSLPADFAWITDADGHQFFLDCLVSDNHEFSNEVTEFPVESGAVVSDNIRRKSDKVTIECVVTNDPIGAMVDKRSTDSAPVADALAFWTKILDDRKPITVNTSLGLFENMAVESLSVPRSAEKNKETFIFTATLVKIRYATNKRSVRVSVPMGKPKTTTNKPPTKPTAVATGPRLSSFHVILRHVPEFPGTQDYYWYDDSFGGWRLGVIKDSNVVSVPGGGSPTFDWVMTQGRPYGVTRTDWIDHRPTNDQLRTRIQVAHDADLPTNPYDIFGDLNSSDGDMFDVRGRRG